jgi:hypothetical protein
MARRTKTERSAIAGESHAAKLLLDSLDGDVDADAEEAWSVEIERRLAKIKAGETKLLPMDEAVARLHRAARGRAGEAVSMRFVAEIEASTFALKTDPNLRY